MLQNTKLPKITDHDDRYQREARAAIKSLDKPGLSRTTVTVTLGATTVLVAHQLGKLPFAWQIIDKNAQADVWRDTTQSVTTDKIPLKASATVTVTIQFW